MKKTYLKYFTLLLGISLWSCEDQLDPRIDVTYTEEFAYTLPERIEGILMNAYAAIPGQFDSYNNNFLDVATDNAVTNAFNTSIYDAATGGISPWSNPIGNWDVAYSQFRNIHLFLDHGLGDHVNYNLEKPETDSLTKVRLKGAAYFLNYCMNLVAKPIQVQHWDTPSSPKHPVKKKPGIWKQSGEIPMKHVRCRFWQIAILRSTTSR